MKCKQAVEWLANPDSESYPQEVRKHLEECEECRRLYEENRFVARLISLKRYEKPVEGSQERIAGAIRNKLSSSGDNELARFMFADTKFFIKPALQVAAASIFIILIGSFFFRQTLLHERETIQQKGMQASQLDARELVGSKPDWMVENTNASPEAIQYGPRRSEVADYDD